MQIEAPDWKNYGQKMLTGEQKIQTLQFGWRVENVKMEMEVKLRKTFKPLKLLGCIGIYFST